MVFLWNEDEGQRMVMANFSNIHQNREIFIQILQEEANNMVMPVEMLKLVPLSTS